MTSHRGGEGVETTARPTPEIVGDVAGGVPEDVISPGPVEIADQRLVHAAHDLSGRREARTIPTPQIVRSRPRAVPEDVVATVVVEVPDERLVRATDADRERGEARTVPTPQVVGGLSGPVPEDPVASAPIEVADHGHVVAPDRRVQQLAGARRQRFAVTGERREVTEVGRTRPGQPGARLVRPGPSVLSEGPLRGNIDRVPGVLTHPVPMLLAVGLEHVERVAQRGRCLHGVAVVGLECHPPAGALGPVGIDVGAREGAGSERAGPKLGATELRDVVGQHQVREVRRHQVLEHGLASVGSATDPGLPGRRPGSHIARSAVLRVAIPRDHRRGDPGGDDPCVHPFDRGVGGAEAGAVVLPDADARVPIGPRVGRLGVAPLVEGAVRRLVARRARRSVPLVVPRQRHRRGHRRRRRRTGRLAKDRREDERREAVVGHRARTCRRRDSASDGLVHVSAEVPGRRRTGREVLVRGTLAPCGRVGPGRRGGLGLVAAHGDAVGCAGWRCVIGRLGRDRRHRRDQHDRERGNHKQR